MFTSLDQKYEESWKQKEEKMENLKILKGLGMVQAAATKPSPYPYKAHGNKPGRYEAGRIWARNMPGVYEAGNFGKEKCKQ